MMNCYALHLILYEALLGAVTHFQQCFAMSYSTFCSILQTRLFVEPLFPSSRHTGIDCRTEIVSMERHHCRITHSSHYQLDMSKKR